MLTNKTVTDLLDAFSAPDPTPGGGSASALAGALGASLLAMVAGLPKTKTGTPEDRAALDAARTRLLDLRATLVALVDGDAAAYELVVAAYKWPKATGEEKAARQAAIQDALRVAIDVPIEILRACLDAVRAGVAVAAHGNPSAKSDVAVGTQLLAAATQGALVNVEINIGSLTDQALVQAFTKELRRLLASSREDMTEVYKAAGIIELFQSIAMRVGTVTPGYSHAPPD